MLLRDATIDELIQMLLATEVSVGANAIETQLLRDELDRRKLRGTQNGIDPDELFPLSRMARRLGVTQAWLRDQADAGNVPRLKVGNRYLFHVAAVQAALAKAAQARADGVSDGQ